jgi:uncharacterized protein YcfJ
MRKLLLIAGLAVAVAAPVFSVGTTADAATRCERNKANNRIAGTIGGGVLGALAGSAIDGSRSNTAGIILGGAAGAYAGNQLTKGHHPCPTGYTARSYTPAASRRVAAASRCTWQDQAYRDGYGNVSHRQVQVCR